MALMASLLGTAYRTRTLLERGRCLRYLQRWYSDGAGVVEPILLRDFIHDSLYHPSEGYFTRSSRPPVGTLPRPLDFPSLSGKDGYLQALRQMYLDLQVSWLTPSELFSPYYGQAIANFIIDRHVRLTGSGRALRIYELGAGTGTLALDICNHMRDAAPELYEHMLYRSVEISPVLARLQEEKVAARGGHISCFKAEVRDATLREGWGPRVLEPCFVLGMEVLDNLPHDRVVREAVGKPWAQTAVLPAGDPHDPHGGPHMTEVLQPLTDGLIKRCLGAGDWAHTKPFWHRLLDYAAGEEGTETDNIVYLPTSCLLLLEALHDARPSHCLLLADFDALPETQIPGRNAPLVATTVGGKTVDHPTVFVPRGTADIFFPTDFKMLERVYEQAGKRSGATSAGLAVQKMKSREFMRRYGNLVDTTVQGGYNPLLQDYENTSFFIGERE